jgi:hypothetical protein
LVSWFLGLCVGLILYETSLNTSLNLNYLYFILFLLILIAMTNINSYLGNKGYTIYKKDLTDVQLNFIETELTVKPFVQGSPGNSTAISFPVYRESSQKIYMPTRRND